MPQFAETSGVDMHRRYDPQNKILHGRPRGVRARARVCGAAQGGAKN
eukprot:COSAG02_NODE_1092_length_14622_cov_95.061971_11_plen_47_part_00